MTTAVEPARVEFATIVGDARVLSDAALCAGLTVDGKVPRCVVFPSGAEQVAAVLKCAAELGLAVIPCRNGTKLGVGNPPRRYDVALSLKEMNRVWHYEPADLTISVEGGMKFGDFQDFVGRQGLWLPLDPAGGARASLGGILATNSAGPLRLRYGAPRDMTLGLKIATSEGKLINCGGRVVKNVAGYDLVKLLVGSFGTLGVIVEASLKLYPVPAERATFVFSVSTLDIARDLRRRILPSPLQPLRMILLDAKAATLTRAGTPWAAEERKAQMWVEAGATPLVMERYALELEGLGRQAGAPLLRLEPRAAALGWTRISDFRVWLAEAHPEVVIVKTVLPAAAGEEFLSRAAHGAQSSQTTLASFSQTGVGVVHLCLLPEERGSLAPGLIASLRRLAESLGGVLMVEKCPVEVKSRLDVWGPPGDDFDVMRKLKLVWDPKGSLVPGRFVGGL